MKIFLIIYCILWYMACGVGCYLYCLKRTKTEKLTNQHRLYINTKNDEIFLSFLLLWPVCLLDIIIVLIQENFN